MTDEKLEYLRVIAKAYPGIKVVEYNRGFKGVNKAVMKRLVLLILAEREQFGGESRV